MVPCDLVSGIPCTGRIICFAVLSLTRDYFLVVSSTNIHDTYLNTQLRYVYINISIIEIDAQTDM